MKSIISKTTALSLAIAAAILAQGCGREDQNSVEGETVGIRQAVTLPGSAIGTVKGCKVTGYSATRSSSAQANLSYSYSLAGSNGKISIYSVSALINFQSIVSTSGGKMTLSNTFKQQARKVIQAKVQLSNLEPFLVSAEGVCLK